MGKIDESAWREYSGDDAPSIELDLTIRAVVDEIDPAVRRIMEVIQASTCFDGDFQHVDLALREALANAVVHGSREDPDKRVEVFVACDESTGLMIVIRDYGEGFDPHKVPNPVEEDNLLSGGGRGVFLINELMDEVTYRKGGRELHMKKK